MVVTRAYLTNEARIGRKITGKSSSFDLVWDLWGFGQARDHSEPIPRRGIDFQKKQGFSKSMDRHGIGSEWSPMCSNPHQTHTRMKLHDLPVILRPI